MADTLNIYTIPEEYRPTWENSMIEAITQPTAGLTQFATRLTNCTGEYVQMQSIGSTDFARRKQRHEKKIAEEVKLGERRIYPVAFGKVLKLSKDDFTFKGGLPITLNTLHNVLNKAAAPLPDRVFLGVEYDETLRNCVIAALTDKSPYWNDGSDTVNTEEHAGQPGGILGPNLTGKAGETPIEIPKHPMLNGILATSFTDYATDIAGLDLRDTNVIPVHYTVGGDGTLVESGLTLGKLEAGRLSLLLKHAITPSTPVNMAITPWQMMDLLRIDKLQNSLYGFQALKDGWFSEILNIRFHVTVDVPIVNIGTEGEPKYVRACPMWLTEDVEFGIWKNPEFEIEKLSGWWDTMLVSLQFAYGAGRKREETVMVIHCDEVGLHGLGKN